MKLLALLAFLFFAAPVLADVGPSCAWPEQCGTGTGGAAVPGLVNGMGNDATVNFLSTLEEPLCPVRLPALYFFDPIRGNDSNDGLSMETAFRSLSKAATICAGTGRTECVFKSGAAWSPLRYPLTSTSGVFVKGETVTYTDGSATLLDYDPVLAVGIFEDNLDPQSVDVGASASGNFTLSYAGNTTANIAFNASAGTVETSLEALGNIGDVSVSGAGSAGDPWVIDFVDPSRPLIPMSGTDVSLDGTLTVASTRLGNSTAITGTASGATASTGTVESVVDDFTIIGAECSNPDELCFRWRPSHPGEQWTVSLNSTSIGGTFILPAATAWAEIEGLRLRRSANDDIFHPGFGQERIILIDTDFEELYFGTNQHLVKGLTPRNLFDFWMLNVGVTRRGTEAGSGNGPDMVQLMDVNFALFTKKPWTNVPHIDSNAPMFAAIATPDGPGSLYLNGLTLDASYMRGGASNSLMDVIEVVNNTGGGPLSVDLVNVVIASPSGDGGTAISADVGSSGSLGMHLQNLTIDGFEVQLSIESAGLATVTADSVVFDNLPAGGQFLDVPTTADVNNTVLTLSNWIHDDDGQTGDWGAPSGDLDTLAAFQSDSDIAARISAGGWTFTNSIDGTSPQWGQPYQCDSAKECFEGASSTRTVSFAVPLPEWVLCEELKSITTTNQNIGAR